MDLLEYQVKEWFSNIGIPVLPSQKINYPADLKKLNIRYPIVLKSQVHAGNREKAGGVRIVETTIDAIAAAQNIFNLPIWGEFPEVLLAESKYESQEELYLAVVLDTTLCRPVLLGCKDPDSDWEAAGEKMQYVVVETEFSPFYGRRLALKMGLEGILMQSVSSVIDKMYDLFQQKDLDLVEINPLGINTSGQIMALNGKIRVNERAINRHPEIADMARRVANNPSLNQIDRILINGDNLETIGKIGILGNGIGSVLTTLDLITNAGGKPGMCLNLRHSFLTDISPTSFYERLEKGLNILATDKTIQVILLNFLGTIPQLYKMPEIITKFIQLNHPKDQKNKRNLPSLVVRLAGSEFNGVKKYLASLQIPDQSLIVVENLDTAVAESIRLAKLYTYKK